MSIVLKNITLKNRFSINTLIGENDMPAKNKFIEYSEEQIKLLGDPDLYTSQVAKMLGIGVSTVVRARQRLGIKVPLGKKKNTIRSKMKEHKRPGRSKQETRTCLHPDCSNTFVVVPSRTKKYCSHRCHSLTVDNSHLQSAEVLAKRTKSTTPVYKRYKALVHRLSGKTYHDNIDIINPERYPRTLNGVEGGWQLDHIIPINECFALGMSAEEAAAVTNLRMLPWKHNLMRNYVNNP